MLALRLYQREAVAAIEAAADRGVRRSPSEKQIALLAKRGLPLRPDTTRGEASDLLSAAFAGART